MIKDIPIKIPYGGIPNAKIILALSNNKLNIIRKYINGFLFIGTILCQKL